MDEGSHRPRPWHLLALLALLAVFIGFEQALERTWLAGIRETALHAADTAQEAALSRLLAKGPISARRDVVLAGDEIVDPGALEAELEGAHGWRVHVGTTAAACPVADAEQVVLVERGVYRGIASSPTGRQVLRCDPLTDRHNEVVGVIAVAAPESMFLHGLGRFRFVSGVALILLLGVVGLLGRAWLKSQEELRQVRAALAEHQANAEAAADLLRRQKESADHELALRVAERDDAVAMEASRSAFLIALSDELRARFDRLIRHAEHVLPEVQGETSREVRQIVDWARTLRASIEDLHDAAALETGQIELVPEPFELQELVDELALAATRALSLGGNTLTITVPDAPLGTMHADRGRVRQVLANLLSNAAKFTRDGQIELLIEPLEEEDAPPRIKFEIRDDGIGMDPVQVARIFDAFVRFEPQIDAPTEPGDPGEAAPPEHEPTGFWGGLGLGLTVVRGLVERMGGAVSVESALGVGSVFTVILPRSRETRGDKDAEAGPSETAAEASSQDAAPPSGLESQESTAPAQTLLGGDRRDE